MELRIKYLKIENFKGIKKFELDFGGQSVNIYGDNRTGKTTIFDAFTWCLFGKDSLGQANFEIKPLMSDGSVKHNLETTVEILFSYDGKDLLLKRVYREIWKGKRGLEAELSGHETLTYINDERVGVKEYEKFINELVSEELFRTLTNVHYFNSLPVAKQRDILFKLVEGITDDDIIAGDKTLAPLWDHLKDGQTVVTLVKILKDKIKQTQKQLDEYPLRISELKNIKYKLPDDYDDDKNDAALSAAYKKQSELEKAKVTGQADSKIDELEKAVRAYDNKIAELQYKLEQDRRHATAGKQQAIAEKTSELNRIRGSRQQKEIELNNFKIRKEKGLATIDEEKAALQKSYDDYRQENAKAFIPEQCAYCGQDLPAAMVEELEKKFNLEKAERLTRIKEKGEATKANIEKYIQAVKGFEETIAKLEAEITALKDQEAAKEKEIAELEAAPVAFDDSQYKADIETEKNRKATCENELAKLKAKQQPTLFDADLEKVKGEIEQLLAYRTEYRIKFENEDRIRTLENEQMRERRRYEDNMKLLELCEKFTVAKRNAFQVEIDSHFEFVKFQLYETHLSGGVREICVATVNGVPYSSLNNEARINAGLDIIRTLQRIYGIKVPIFIDNAESTTRFLPLDCQMIKLYVSEADKKLRFELLDEHAPAAAVQPVLEEITEKGEVN